MVCYQVDDPYLVAFLTKTPIFEWYVVRCGSKNGYQKHMCFKEIGLCAHDLITILSSIVSLNGGICMTR